MRDPHTKESRGFAFVTMENVEDAEAAIAALSATELMGRTMNIEKARRGRARTRALLCLPICPSFKSKLTELLFLSYSHSWAVPRSP
jgi:RNA recognition motif-containing protein